MLRRYLDSGDISELEELARKEYDDSSSNAKNLLSSQASAAILQRIHGQLRVEKPARVKLFNIYRLTAAAAIVIVIGSIGFIKRAAIVNMFFPVQMVTVSTLANQEKTVTLADGSVATLEANSTFVYPEKFTGETRDVSLKGEAFFKIAKDKEHPFTVHSPLVNTTVVGTEFNVDDKDSMHAKVVVVTGIVKVQAAGNTLKQEVRLTPEEGAVYGTDNKLLRKIISPDDARFYKQRRDGIFVYDGAAACTVTARLSRVPCYFSCVPCLFSGAVCIAPLSFASCTIKKPCAAALAYTCCALYPFALKKSVAVLSMLYNLNLPIASL